MATKALSRSFLQTLLAALTFAFLLYFFYSQSQLRQLKGQQNDGGALNSPLSEEISGGSSSLSAAQSLSSSISNEDILIYNKIPKTASTTLTHLAYKLSTDLGYSIMLINNTRSSMPYKLTFFDQAYFSKNASLWRQRKPVLYHGHFAHISFDQFGYAKPIYINMIRRPLDRLVSYYYFLRYGDDYNKGKHRSRMGDTVDFDECYRRRLPDCDPKKMWLQIPFFCGSFKKCWEPGNRWALEQAKWSVVNNYFLVGLTEDLESFIDVLEFSLPKFFAGVTDLYRSSLEDNRHIRKTKYKLDPSEETVAAVQDTKTWKLENEFYEFVSAHFHSVRNEFLEQKTKLKGKISFHYQKVRPA